MYRLLPFSRTVPNPPRRPESPLRRLGIPHIFHSPPRYGPLSSPAINHQKVSDWLVLLGYRAENVLSETAAKYGQSWGEESSSVVPQVSEDQLDIPRRTK